MSATDIAKSVDVDLDMIQEQAASVAEELIETAKMKEGQILVVGCSSSEIAAHAIGCYSSKEVGEAVFNALYKVTRKNGLYLAAQCCEHLNRAIIIEEEAALKYGLEMVNVKPQLKAGGSFSTAAWNGSNTSAASGPLTSRRNKIVFSYLKGLLQKERSEHAPLQQPLFPYLYPSPMLFLSNTFWYTRYWYSSSTPSSSSILEFHWPEASKQPKAFMAG